MTLIIIIEIAIYFILISWTWTSLGYVEKNKKIKYIILGIIIIFVLTFLIFNFSKIGIDYEKNKIIDDMEKVLLGVFTGINGIILMPQIGKILDKINEDEIEPQKAKKRLIIIIIIFLLFVIFERLYIKDALNGIISTYNRLGK